MGRAAATVVSPNLTEAQAASAFDYFTWEKQLPELTEKYQHGKPFPHIVIDDFMRPESVQRALDEFPSIRSGKWIHYLHANEKKYGKTDFSNFSPGLRAIVEEVHSPRFIHFLSELSSIDGIFPDPDLEGGGLHQSARRGFLNIHADFNAHPHHRSWRRRMNLLLYLNRDWKDEYGGHLELWDKKMRHCMRRIAPLFNRCVIFNTDPDAFHGHPEPLQCPPQMSRKSMAFYYFTKEQKPVRIRSTDYQARPKDGMNRVWIYLDKMALHLYDRIKRRLGFNDDLASKTLKSFDRYQEKRKRAKRIHKIRKKKQ